MGILASRFLPLRLVPGISSIGWSCKADSIATVQVADEKPSRQSVHTALELIENIANSALIGATPFCLSLIAAPSVGSVEVTVPSSSTTSFDGLALIRLDGGSSRSSIEPCLSSFSVFVLVTSSMAGISGAMSEATTTAEGVGRSERFDISISILAECYRHASILKGFSWVELELLSPGSCGVNFTSNRTQILLSEDDGVRTGTPGYTYSDLFRSELANLGFESVLAVVPIGRNDVIRLLGSSLGCLGNVSRERVWRCEFMPLR